MLACNSPPIYSLSMHKLLNEWLPELPAILDPTCKLKTGKWHQLVLFSAPHM